MSAANTFYDYPIGTRVSIQGANDTYQYGFVEKVGFIFKGVPHCFVRIGGTGRIEREIHVEDTEYIKGTEHIEGIEDAGHIESTGELLFFPVSVLSTAPM
ncbi:hypothetical protein EW145_g5367 [Phellinidium pouzarii]|uniref:Uncharacterized protein n=1 Tax=Phellinidium pouzarii TaxID=167371 RepID=A0A4S4L075_9AGAM|nr:hypothetical protein EW145_g5367 [Phellinidium pouzarii]